MFSKRHGNSFRQWVINAKRVDTLVHLFVNKKESTLVNLLVTIFLGFLTDDQSKDPFIKLADIVFIKTIVRDYLEN